MANVGIFFQNQKYFNDAVVTFIDLLYCYPYNMV